MMRSNIICILHYFDDKMKREEISRTCSIDEGNEKFVFRTGKLL